jgi:DASH complex subunit ASK1
LEQSRYGRLQRWRPIILYLRSHSYCPTQFWTSFYEEAAQIRIPALDDYSSILDERTRSDNDSRETTTQSDTTTTYSRPADPSHHSHLGDPSIAGSSESSFGQAAYSSTPATTRGLSASIAPPSFDQTQDEDASVKDARHVSPLKIKAKAKTPVQKILNPYLPPNTEPADWTGIVDLRDPSIATPQKQHHDGKRRKTPRHREKAEESFDGLPEGMSPPRMMSPAAPPRSSAELGLLKLAQSPIKDAAERIKRDLISDAEKMRSGGGLFGQGRVKGGTESSLSTVSTPPSLSRYTRHGRYAFDSSSSMLDPSLESMLQRVGLHTSSQSGIEVPAAGPMDDVSLRTPLPDSDFSDSDSLDEIHNTAHPSTAFIMASQQARRLSLNSDDSFGSSNDSVSSLSQEPVHPFAREAVQDDFDDDSFDDGYERREGEEETVFGLPPAERQRPRQSELRLLGDHLLDDTLGIGAEIVQSGRPVAETPTPWARN